VLTFANLLATVLRFVLFRVWVFRKHREPDVPAADPERETFSRNAVAEQKAVISA